MSIAIQNFLNMVATQFDVKVTHVRLDNGIEFIQFAWATLFVEKGILH